MMKSKKIDYGYILHKLILCVGDIHFSGIKATDVNIGELLERYDEVQFMREYSQWCSSDPNKYKSFKDIHFYALLDMCRWCIDHHSYEIRFPYRFDYKLEDYNHQYSLQFGDQNGW